MHHLITETSPLPGTRLGDYAGCCAAQSQTFWRTEGGILLAVWRVVSWQLLPVNPPEELLSLKTVISPTSWPFCGVACIWWLAHVKTLRPGHYFSLVQLWYAILVLSPCDVAAAFKVAAFQPSSSLCPVLLLSFPTGVDPINAPKLSSCPLISISGSDCWATWPGTREPHLCHH